MTLEPQHDPKPEKKSKWTYGKTRRMQALRRSHLRERDALQEKQDTGIGLSEQETARLRLLRELYD